MELLDVGALVLVLLGALVLAILQANMPKDISAREFGLAICDSYIITSGILALIQSISAVCKAAIADIRVFPLDWWNVPLFLYGVLVVIWFVSNNTGKPAIPPIQHLPANSSKEETGR
jgi:hypothetical protein